MTIYGLKKTRCVTLCHVPLIALHRTKYQYGHDIIHVFPQLSLHVVKAGLYSEVKETLCLFMTPTSSCAFTVCLLCVNIPFFRIAMPKRNSTCKEGRVALNSLVRIRTFLLFY